jgi:ribosomal protein S18 acetylase RimI-like enzyme
LGHALSDSSLAALYEAGARIVHLMTTPGNVVAERFWERQGFTRQTFKYFVEMDI